MFWLIAALVFIIGIMFLDRFQHRIFTGSQEIIYLVAKGEIPQIEWLIRDVCSYIRHQGRYSLAVVNQTEQEESFILHKLGRLYNFQIYAALPPSAEKVVRIDGESTPKKLRREIMKFSSLSQNSGPKKENMAKKG